MDNNEAIDDFTSRVSTDVNKLHGLGEKLDEGYIMKKMLHAVSSKFIQIISTVEELDSENMPVGMMMVVVMDAAAGMAMVDQSTTVDEDAATTRIGAFRYLI